MAGRFGTFWGTTRKNFRNSVDFKNGSSIFKTVGFGFACYALHDLLHKSFIKEPCNLPTPTCLDIESISETHDLEMRFLQAVLADLKKKLS